MGTAVHRARMRGRTRVVSETSKGSSEGDSVASGDAQVEGRGKDVRQNAKKKKIVGKRTH